jgi:hypothetical protein
MTTVFAVIEIGFYLHADTNDSKKLAVLFTTFVPCFTTKDVNTEDARGKVNSLRL